MPAEAGGGRGLRAVLVATAAGARLTTRAARAACSGRPELFAARRARRPRGGRARGGPARARVRDTADARATAVRRRRLVPLGLVVLARSCARRRRRSSSSAARASSCKVISGDNPDTVAAIARDAGIPVDRRRRREPAGETRARARRATGGRPDLARGQEGVRRGAARLGPVRRHGRRRRQRRARAEGGAPRDRARERRRRWRSSVADVVLVARRLRRRAVHGRARAARSSGTSSAWRSCSSRSRRSRRS